MALGFLGKSDGTSLITHTGIVTKMCAYLADNIIRESFNKQHLKEACIIAAALHDIGKVDSQFQSYIQQVNAKLRGLTDDMEGVLVSKTNYVDFAQHNLISWMFIKGFLTITNRYVNAITHSVLYHHALTNKNKEKYQTVDSVFEVLSEEDIANLQEFTEYVINLLKTEYNIHSVSFNPDGYNESNSLYKREPYYIANERKEKSKEYNEYNFIVKSCLIYADRVSSNPLYKHELVRLYECGELTSEVFDKIKDNMSNITSDCNMLCPDGFDEVRFNKQVEIAHKSSTNPTSTIIKASAGFGKTITALLYITNIKKKSMWVCPTNSIAVSTYESIVDELKLFKLDLSVELLIANEIKQSHNTKEGNADIVVTNIDNFLRSTIKNDNAERCYDLLNYNVIFDEFHELDSTSAIFAGFVNIMRVRHKYTTVPTLLMSATPEKLHVLWDSVENKTDIIKVDALNNLHGKYRFHLHVSDLDVVPDKKDVLVIFNSISRAQEFYTNNEHFDTLYHSSFLDNDKEAIRTVIRKNHNKHIRRDEAYSPSNVVATRILGTGLDISFSELHESVASIDLTMQALGRVNRYGEISDTIDVHLYKRFTPKLDRSEQCAISINYKTELSDLWFNFLAEKLVSCDTYNLVELYAFYDEFYERENVREVYHTMIDEFLVASSLNYARLEPVKYYTKQTKKSDTIKLQEYSLRSSNESAFVVCLDENTGNVIESPLQMEVAHFMNIEELVDVSTRKEFYKDYLKDCPSYNYGFKGNGSVNMFTFSNMKKESVYSHKPFPLLNYIYDNELGLRKLDVFNINLIG
ncbi:MAG: CRISPR-associated endonuclease Cas3'' [Bacteroidales bacterium]